MNKKVFVIPNMVLLREDVRDYSDKKFSDDEMELIANKLSNFLMNEWADCLELAVREVSQRKRRDTY